MRYYFAYGSNINPTSFYSTCPTAQRIGVARLDDYMLVFDVYSSRRKSGAANIRSRKGSHVEGVVWEVTDEQEWQALNAREGHPFMYVRQPIVVELQGEPTEVEMYIKPPVGNTRYLPAEEYLHFIIDEPELSKEYRKNVIKKYQYLKTELDEEADPDEDYDMEVDTDPVESMRTPRLQNKGGF